LNEVRAGVVFIEQAVLDGNDLQARTSAGFKDVVDFLEIARPVFAAHGLEHLDRGDAVEAPLNIAIIEQANVRAFGQPRLEHATTGVVMLFARDRHAGDDGSDLSRGELGETAPAAADLQHAMAGLKIHEPRQGGVFGALGVLQRLARSLEPRRGIGHRRVQPGGVEGVSEVVMGVDVAPRSATAIAVQPMPQPVDRVHQRVAVEQATDVIVVVDQGLQQDRKIRRVPLPRHIALGEADIAAPQHPGGEARIADHQNGRVPRRRPGQLSGRPVRQHQRQTPPGPV